MATNPTMITMSGAQINRTVAAGALSGTVTKNSVIGARMAKMSCGMNSSKKL